MRFSSERIGKSWSEIEIEFASCLRMADCLDDEVLWTSDYRWKIGMRAIVGQTGGDVPNNKAIYEKNLLLIL